MKPNRNAPCPCGSGKKYKFCCIDVHSKRHLNVVDDIEQIASMNPNLTIDELNVVAQRKMAEYNNRPNPDFCGLSPNQMANWLYASFDKLDGMTITPPEDLSNSPVMRYLSLILDEAIQKEGAFKSTAKGNLPVKLVNQANELLPEFAIYRYEKSTSLNEYSGKNEDAFNALHYTRVLAEMSGIIYHRGGHFRIKKEAKKRYQQHGIQAFFLLMLETATTQYNWGYLDRWEDDIDLRALWVFMLWRVSNHVSFETLIEETLVAFPDFLSQFTPSEYSSAEEQAALMIEVRFINRFLQFWGFAIVEPKNFFSKETVQRPIHLQPTLLEAIHFHLKPHNQ